MTKTEFSTNIAGKVRNTKLPKTKALWPLYEVISNSIDAIEETRDLKKGEIHIKVIRNGKPDILAQTSDVSQYPIQSFEVKDNGIGLTNQNFISFLTAESDYKIEKGAKGIGRFVSLKAFRSVFYDSVFKYGEKLKSRKFEFRASKKGIFNYTEKDLEAGVSGTTVRLNIFREMYVKYCPLSLESIAEKIVTHFLIYFIQGKAPKIELIDSNGGKLLLQDYYKTRIQGTIKKEAFTLNDTEFFIWLLKAYNTRTTHNIHFCANDREVKTEKLSQFIPDLGKRIEDKYDNFFVYHAYITSPYLDQSVDSDRTDFSILQSDEDSESEEISLKKIRENAVLGIERLLVEYLTKVRSEKFEAYESHIYESAPQFKTILKYNPEAITSMPPNLSGNKLDIELFKLQNDLETNVKELGHEIFLADDDYRNSEEYQNNYTEYIEKFNDVGKANLAKYIVHRKSVIELLDKFIGFDDDGKFQTEDTIHNIFFPIKSESDEINYNQQNLWLIDERLSYHTYLASDKAFRKMGITDSKSLDRPDLLIFNDSFAFVDDVAPHNSYTIVEFKRPERGDYSNGLPKKNPVDQVLSYIRTIRDNKAKDRKGKIIQFVGPNVPFYAYIIADFNQNLKNVLDDKDFKKTPDGMGYFKFHDKYNAYIEVVTYQKVLQDAKMRNRILFDKLGLPTN